MKKVEPWPSTYTTCDYYMCKWKAASDRWDGGHACDDDFLEFIKRAEGKTVEWCENMEEGVGYVYFRCV